MTDWIVLWRNGDESVRDSRCARIERVIREKVPSPYRAAEVRIEHAIGNPHSPTNPFGRSLLVIEPGGRARLEHRTATGHFGVHSVFHDASVEESLIAQLLGALAAAGFPAYENSSRAAVPDATFGLIRVTRVGMFHTIKHWLRLAAPQEVTLQWHEADKLPGYREAKQILDAIVARLKESPPQPD